MYDVAVIGGGPVGSRVAYRLAGLGYGVIVLEQKPAAGAGVCCTGIIGQECVKSFTVSDRLVLRQAQSATLFSPSGESLRLYRDEVQASILDRAGFDAALAELAQASGAEYRFNCHVTDIEVSDDRVGLKTCHTTIAARAAVIATGFNSRLVEKTGFGRISRFVVGAQVEVPAPNLNEIEIYFGNEIAPGFFAWLVPTKPGRARVGLLAKHHPGHYLKRLMASLEAQGKIVPDSFNPCYQGVPLKPLSRTHNRRIIVAGTAAGQVKPTTGGGIYYGLICADIAAETLDRALTDDDLSAKSLSRYDREWRGRIGAELKRGYRVRRLYNRLSDNRIDRLFTIIKETVLDDMLLSDSGMAFDWHSGGLLKILGKAAISRITRPLRNAFHPRKE